MLSFEFSREEIDGLVLKGISLLLLVGVLHLFLGLWFLFEGLHHIFIIGIGVHLCLAKSILHVTVESNDKRELVPIQLLCQ